MKARWCIVSDGDSKRYLCPIEKRDEAEAVLEEINDYWADHENLHDRSKECPDVPSYLQPLDNDYHLTFTDPKMS